MPLKMKPAQREVVNGEAGLVATVGGRPVAVFGPTVRGGRFVEITIVADPHRVAELVRPGE
ncbi:hypothetical protein AB0C38_12075 [Amycolatopsis sp. NPDC048633]|uniref:hypothetical protein n=1 Tax=Amycolatopsis sp. NPDC048633 TaxID=3157095 RepID=UPI0033F01496